MAEPSRRKRAKTRTGKVTALEKIETGVAGLDAVLHGGVPAGRTTLVSGGPGSGKSLLGLEFLYRGAVSGAPGIFVTFEERADAVRQNAATMGWDLSTLEADGKFFLMQAYVAPQAVLSGDFDLKALFAVIDGKAKAMGASRIVVDAVDVLLRLFDDPNRERNELYTLHDWLTAEKMTTLITAKTSRDGEHQNRYDFLEFMADCVLVLDNRVVEQRTTRRIRVLKYRGSSFGSNEYPFVMKESGIHVVPITSLDLRHTALGPPVSSGHSRLDAVLDGGFRRASCVLVAGAAGTGKSTLAATFARGACERGEKVLYLNFEESSAAMLSCMLSPGIDLRPFVKGDTLRILTALPEAVGAEEHLVRSLTALEEFEPAHLVIDAISACRRMGSEQVAFDYVMRMVDACKSRGTTAILLNQISGITEEQEISGIGISSIMDSVIILRYLNIGGEVNRTLLVMKARGTKHSNQFREYMITDNGIDIADVYVGEGGVLTGVARQEQEARDRAEHRLRQQEIDRKEKEVARQRAALDAEALRLQSELAAAEAELEQLRLGQKASVDERTARATARGAHGGDTRPGTASPQKKKKRSRRGGNTK